jgi:hypothetical protein
MGISRFSSLLVFIFLTTGCYIDKYTEYKESFFSIYLKEWNSTICPKKIAFEKYVKNSNFKELIESNSDFEIKGCEKTESEFNQRIFTPNTFYIGEINYDIKLIIDDSLEFKITNIQNKLDTVAEKAGPKKWIIMNNINSLIVNGYELDNTKTPLNIWIPTKLGKIIRK